MFKKMSLLVLAAMLFSYSAKAQSQADTTKYDAWSMGTNLSIAAFSNAVNLTPAEIKESFDKAQKNADKFGIKLPPLPAKSTVRAENTRRLIEYFVEKAGAPTQKYLKANFGEEHAAAFDIGVATNIYFFLQIAGDTKQTEIYSPIFLFMIEDRTKTANLPVQTTEELIKLDGQKSALETVEKAVLNTMTKVAQYLMKRDETEIGDRLIERGKFAEALIQYTKVIKYDPNFAEAYFKRGLAYQKIGKEDLAKLDFEKAESLEPGIVQKLSAKK